MAQKIKLETSDGQILEVDKDVIIMSQTIKNMLEDISSETDALPITNVNSVTLKKVIEYCEYHHAHPTTVTEKEDYRTDNIIDWDQKYLEVEMKLLFDIISAANFLDIKGLLDLCCKVIANIIKGKTPDEIKVTFAKPKKN